MNYMRFYTFLYCFLILPLIGCTLHAQSIPPVHFQHLEYRMIGPFRAGRTVGAVGVPTQPNLFFMGVNNGGVWKTDDYGRTWLPIFDKIIDRFEANVSPNNLISPVFGLINESKQRIVVLFPAPLGPRKPNTSPVFT